MMEHSSKLERAKRLKYLRHLTGLSITSFAKLTSTSQGSVSFWERGMYGGLTQKAAQQIAKAVKAHGIECSEAWLLLGIGNSPLKTIYEQPNFEQRKDFLKNVSAQTNYSEQECQWFLHHRENAVVVDIEHYALAPFLQRGDKVGGCWHTVDEVFIPAEGLLCIVEQESLAEARLVFKAKNPGLFHLSFSKFDAELHAPFVQKDVPLERIAPVLRVWRELITF